MSGKPEIGSSTDDAQNLMAVNLLLMIKVSSPKLQKTKIFPHAPVVVAGHADSLGPVDTLLTTDWIIHRHTSGVNHSLFLFILLFQAILDVVVNLQFSLIEKLWQTFWRYSPPDSVEGTTITENR